MNVVLRNHTKKAHLYDTQEDYLRAARLKIGHVLTDSEQSFLLNNAVTRTGAVGSHYLWNTEAVRVVGSFAVCDHCIEVLGKSNDSVTITTPRLGRGSCEICNAQDRVLRKVAVNNFGHVAAFTTKQAAVLSRGQTVKIVDAPARFNALIGDFGEVTKVTVGPRGVLYEVKLANGMKVPYEFWHTQLEAVESAVPVEEIVNENPLELANGHDDYDFLLGE